MDALEFLNRGHRCQYKIDKLYEQVDFWEEQVLNVSSRINENGKVQCSKGKDTNELIIKIVECKMKIEKEISNALKIKLEIQDIIRQVKNPVYQSILFQRYVEEKMWDEIVSNEHMTKRNMFFNHKKAIREVNKLLKSV